MDNLGFLASAYALTFLIIAAYWWSLRRRIRRARRMLESDGPGSWRQR